MQVSYIEPNAASVQLVPLIRNLPVSNHDHAPNQLEFDHAGRLLISIGSNTNAGVPLDKMGGLPVRGRVCVSHAPANG